MSAEKRIDHARLIANVPAELKKLKNWVGWKFEPNKDNPEKLDKVPMNTLTGQRAKSNVPSTWADFDTTLDLAVQRNYDGIGFMFTPPYIGIDLDDCIDQNGVISTMALDILKTADCYCEHSPSGSGVHLILKGTIKRSRKLSQIDLEIYGKGRFFTFTGNRLTAYSADVGERTEAVQKIWERYIEGAEQCQKILKLIAQSNDAEKFNKLFSGSWQGDYPSQSEADLALCSKLAFWTGKDAALMDSLFRRSKLLREKWDTTHYGDGRTYGQGVIEKAIESCDQVYLPASNDHKPTNNNDVAAQILKEHTLIHYADKFYEYRKGCYRPLYIEEVHKWIKEIIGKKFSISKVNNILLSLKTEVFKKPDDIKNVTHLNVKNGLYDVTTYQLTSHTPDVYSINQLNVNYDEKAVCPIWIKTLGEILEGDQARINLLQEFFSYCLTRETDYEKALFLNGEGSNGKTVILYVLEQLLGKENCCSIPLEKFSDFHYLPRLAGKIANISIETNAKSEVYDNMFKAVVTGDTISADEKYGQPFEFKPFCKLIFATNNLPRVDDKLIFYSLI